MSTAYCDWFAHWRHLWKYYFAMRKLVVEDVRFAKEKLTAPGNA